MKAVLAAASVHLEAQSKWLLRLNTPAAGFAVQQII
jgi:hypothetical protein